MPSYPCFLFASHENGYLSSLRFDFPSGLTTLMGPRGTGKSTALEAVPYALGLSPSKPRSARVESLRRKNFGGACVRIGYRTREGVVYTIQRVHGEAPVVKNERGEVIQVPPSEVVRFAFYGQNEFDTIANDKSAQLALLDRFVEGELPPCVAEIRKMLRDLEVNASELLRLQKEVDELDEATAEVPALEETLRVVQEVMQGVDERVARRAHASKVLRERERCMLDAVVRETATLRSDLGRLIGDSRRRLAGTIDPDVPQGPNGEILQPVVDEVQRTVDLLEQMGTRGSKQTLTVDAEVAQRRAALQGRHAEQDEEYRKLLAQSNEESTRVAERTRTQQKYAALVEKKRTLTARRTEWQRRRGDRRTLLAHLSKLRAQVFRAREETAKRLSERLVDMKVSVGEGGNTEAYAEFLAEVLSNVKIGKSTGAAIKSIVKSILPENLAAAVEAHDTALLVDKVEDLTALMAGRFLDEVRKSGRLYELDAMGCDDLVTITLRDGTTPKPIDETSQGQHAVALLMILLAEGDWPLIIDQPEDHLDGRYISETLVPMILKVKLQRQLIFVTHNATLLVLSDPERNYALGSNGKCATIAAAGTVNETKDDILRCLDGGPEAFLARKKRYGF
ncbi:MAG TPA: AAA family ATPase [Polyangiaceae bacterium]